MTEDPKIAHAMRVTRCRTCNAQIVWLKTTAGRDMPVNADTVAPGDITFDRAKHKSHFSTCKDADQHRKPR